MNDYLPEIKQKHCFFFFIFLNGLDVPISIIVKTSSKCCSEDTRECKHPGKTPSRERMEVAYTVNLKLDLCIRNKIK